MEALKSKYENFFAANSAFGKAILLRERKITEMVDDPDLRDVLSAGVIKHFESAYETAWKYLKQYLSDITKIEVASPRGVFQACYKYGILPESVVNELLQLAEARNKTTHIYNQVIAREVYDAVEHHHNVFTEVLRFAPLPEDE